MIDTLKVEDFFDLSLCPYKELFDPEKNPWEIIASLKGFIQSRESFEINSDIPPGAVLVNPDKIQMGRNCTIYPGAYIEGPCFIGGHVRIGHGAYIRPYSILSDHCNLGHASEIKESIMLPYSSAPHFNYLGNSILGSYANLGAGVILANYKLNGSEVIIRSEDEKIPTGLKKLGAIVGDHASLGCNSVTNPGTLLSKGFFCKPCTSLQGVYLVEQKRLSHS